MCIGKKQKDLATPHWVNSARGVGNQMRDDRQMTEIIKK